MDYKQMLEEMADLRRELARQEAQNWQLIRENEELRQELSREREKSAELRAA